ncbi:MAG TPA: adenosylmethionine--8-amino-7-oxononanoate transaminase [Kofleriaceae bacterium]|nr:adenosylmethionine--8-amino-7-oxononanoate transaminase [Kofleriaceae bacterium]
MWHPFTQHREWAPLVIARGDGNFLIDTEGRRYLDGVSSLWCNVHGHHHPRLDAALRQQLDQLAHSTFLGLSHEPGIRLAAELLDVAPRGTTGGSAERGPLARVFYSDSGSTAVEIALKQSFQYWALRGRPKKQRFLRMTDAYHGDTLGAVGVGGIDVFHRIFGPLLVQSIPIPTPAGTDGSASLARIESELQARSFEIAAFIFEPLIQGAAGMLVHPPGFLAKVAELCQRHNVHLILDEVATGFGRTGRMFACEHELVSPDFLCLAKGISGGYLPLAATLCTEEIFSAFLGTRAEMKHFFHGHTYTANPLACAVGLESLRLLREQTLANAQAREPEIAAALSRVGQLPGVKEARRVGLMIGIELEGRADRFVGVEVCERARAHGVILRPLGDVVVWMPPLSIRSEEVDLLESATTAAIRESCGSSFHVKQ